MPNELDNIDLESLSMDEVKKLKNQAIERLRSSGVTLFQQASHQNGSHGDHTNHSTHSNMS